MTGSATQDSVGRQQRTNCRQSSEQADETQNGNTGTSPIHRTGRRISEQEIGNWSEGEKTVNCAWEPPQPSDKDKTRRADRKPSVHSRICSCHFPAGGKNVPVLFLSTNDVPTGQILEDHSYSLRQDSADVPKNVPPPMDEEEEMATQFMADKDDEPSPADQTLTINSEEQPNSSTTKEELQSERRKRIQLEIELEHSIAEIQFLKDKLQGQTSNCHDRLDGDRIAR
ncbi:unnamed protein product [Leuciscus chuanchicus]